MFASIEFYERAGGTNKGFVEELYRRILAREPERARHPARPSQHGQRGDGLRDRLSPAQVLSWLDPLPVYVSYQ